MGCKRLLAVFGHPDDESLAAGGLLAARAAAGAATAVVTATWAEGTHRADELADALSILGAGEPRLLGYADAGVPESAPGADRWCDLSVDEAADAVAGHIRDFRPDVLVTFDRHGGITGHPDHVQAHRATLRAAATAGVGDVRLATHPRSLAPRIATLIAPKALHTTPDDLAEKLDVRAWLEQKVAAILAHRSQVERRSLPGLVAEMSPAVRDELLGSEWFARQTVTPSS